MHVDAMALHARAIEVKYAAGLAEDINKLATRVDKIMKQVRRIIAGEEVKADALPKVYEAIDREATVWVGLQQWAGKFGLVEKKGQKRKVGKD